jgi:hypothetical protein
LKPARPGRSIRDPADPRLEPGRVEEKIEEGPGKKPGYNPLTFVFFLLKRRRFDFLKKLDPDDPVTRSKPGTWVLNRTGLKTMGFITCLDSPSKKFIQIKWLLDLYKKKSIIFYIF